MESPLKNTKRIEACNKIPGSYVQNVHGYHRECYQSFRNITYVSKQSVQNNNKTYLAAVKLRKKKTSNLCRYVSFSQNTCMFRDKETIYVKRN